MLTVDDLVGDASHQAGNNGSGLPPCLGDCEAKAFGDALLDDNLWRGVGVR